MQPALPQKFAFATALCTAQKTHTCDEVRAYNGQFRYISPLMTGSTPARAVQVDISGATELALVVHYGWDGYAFDHADWADARLVCTP